VAVPPLDIEPVGAGAAPVVALPGAGGIGDAADVPVPAAEEPVAGAAPIVDEPVAGAAPAAGEPVVGAAVDDPPAGGIGVLAPAPGCIAEDPVVVEPEPEAIGRSVGPDGDGVVWARAGAAAKAVATRQAAMCFFSMFISKDLV